MLVNIKNIPPPSSCLGSLFMVFQSTVDQRLQDKVYKISATLVTNSKNKPIFVRNDGNCCWKLIEKQRQKQKETILNVGDHWIPTKNFHSFEKQNC